MLIEFEMISNSMDEKEENRKFTNKDVLLVC